MISQPHRHRLSNPTTGRLSGAVLAAWLLTSVLSAAPSSEAATFYVDQEGTGDFTTIQAAVDAASPGDEIRVYGEALNGDQLLYLEAVNIEKDVDLLSVNRADEVAGHPSAIVHSPLDWCCSTIRVAEATGVRIEGFTVMNDSLGTRTQTTAFGGAMAIVDSANVTVAKCRIAKSTALEEGGGVIVLLDAFARFESCEFSDNFSGQNGGGLLVEFSQAEIVASRFERNIALGRGGALVVEDLAEVTVANAGPDRVFFIDNQAGTSGGAIRATSADLLRVEGATFQDNVAQWGGAFYGFDSFDPVTYEFIDCIFESNQATNPNGGGGAMFNDGIDPSIQNCQFTGNTGFFGGALDNFIGSDPTINDSLFQDNEAFVSGGAISNYTASGSITDTDFISNTAQYGGAIQNFSDSDPQISNCFFDSNVASVWGGAIRNLTNSDPDIGFCTFDDNQALGEGGALQAEDDSRPMVGLCFFNTNSAGAPGGGAVAIFDGAATAARGGTIGEDRGAHPSLLPPQQFGGEPVAVEPMAVEDAAAPPSTWTNVWFTGNSTSGVGGAFLAWDSAIEMSGCEFSLNSASRAAAIDQSGGSLVAERCVISGNVADQDNGGYRGYNSAVSSFLNCMFDQNVVDGGSPPAPPYGGAAAGLFTGASADFVNCTIAYNEFNLSSSILNGGGGIRAQNATVNVTNGILWGNVDAQYAGTEGEQILPIQSPASVNHSCVQNWSGQLGGVANSSDDPQFIDAPVDLHVRDTSPTLEGGDNSVVTWTEDLDGNPRIDGVVDLGVYEGGISVEAVTVESAPAAAFQLHGNAPNPFNPSTTIRYELPAAARVELGVFDVSGRLVRTLVAGAARQAGTHTLRWDGRNDDGREVASGVYFLYVEAGGERATRRMVLAR